MRPRISSVKAATPARRSWSRWSSRPAKCAPFAPQLEPVAAEFGETLGKPGIPFGTMIELPRAALSAGRLAPLADFFSFGSNDLTQMTFGFSRDDAEEKFLRFYLEKRLPAGQPVRAHR